jgi:hypothetical protein
VLLLFFSGHGLEESSLGLNSKFSSLSVIFVGLLFHSLNVSQIGVQFFHSTDVLQWVLLLLRVEGSVFLAVSDSRLNSIGVDDLGNIRVGQDSSVEVISTLALSSNSVSSEDLVKSLEGRFSPDDESSEMSTRSQLLKVKSVDVANFNTGDVSDSSDEGGVFVAVDEEGTLAESVSSVSELSFTSSDDLSVGDSFNIFVSAESLQESNSILSLFDTFELVIDNQRKVGDVVDSVASSQNKRSYSRSSQSSGNSMSLLFNVNLSVPSSPDLEGSEHSTFSDGVGEGTLSSSGGTRTTDSWNSCDGTTGTPRDGGVLHTSMNEDSVGLTNVLGDLVMNELNNIESDGSSADSGKGNLASDFLGIS